MSNPSKTNYIIVLVLPTVGVPPAPGRGHILVAAAARPAAAGAAQGGRPTSGAFTRPPRASLNQRLFLVS